MGTRTPVLLRPHWLIINQLTLPVNAVDNKGTAKARGVMQIFLPITIFLDTIFEDKSGYTTRSKTYEHFS